MKSMKRNDALLILTVLSAMLIGFASAEAKSGCCSSHGGVDCATGPQSNGHVICNDRWYGSSCLYSEMVMCGSYQKEDNASNSTVNRTITYSKDNPSNLKDNKKDNVSNSTVNENVTHSKDNSSKLKDNNIESENSDKKKLVNRTTILTNKSAELINTCDIGFRSVIAGSPSYCKSGKWEPQKVNGQSCQNNFECNSNFCNNESCYDISAKVAEHESTLQLILGWFRKNFHMD